MPGIPAAILSARAYVEASTLHDRAHDDEVALIWRSRHRLPLHRQSLVCSADGRRHAVYQQGAKLGDPIALVARSRERVNDYSAVLTRAGDSPLERLHGELIEWAKTEYHWSGPRTKKMQVALDMGWTNVADSLEQNPFLLSGLLTYSRRVHEFDAPGILLAGEFILKSRFSFAYNYFFLELSLPPFRETLLQ